MTHFYLWIRHIDRSTTQWHPSGFGGSLLGKRLCIGTCFLALLLLLTTHPASPVAPLQQLQAAPSVQSSLRDAFPSYIGPSTIHIDYTYQSACVACRRDLEVVLPDQSVEVLDTLGLGSVTGSYRHEGLASGNYGYRIVETEIIDGEPKVISTTTRYGTVDGLTVSGRLLFDETLHVEFACQSPLGVTVSEGHDFMLDGAWLNSNCRITLEEGATFSVQGSDFLGSNLSIGGAGAADIIGSTFHSPVNLNVGSEVAANITQSHFRGTLQLEGPARTLRFQGNHFADAVGLLTRSAVIFEDNLFLSNLILDDALIGAPNTWCQDNGLRPTIEGNSFVGEAALNYSIKGCNISSVNPIDVGSNYYGDPQGPLYAQNVGDPVVPGIDYGKRWLQRGALVLPNPFRLSSPLASGRQWQDTQVFPSFWLNGYRLGQHTVTNQLTDLMRGKESLFTMDLVTSHGLVEGAEVWVMWNGERVDPSSPLPASLKLVRDLGRSAVVLRSARTTIDFFLPPAEGEAATLELWLDTRSLDGFPHAGTSGGLEQLADLSVPLRAPPPLIGIHIVPVTIDDVRPSIGPMRATLESATPAMLPVASENLRISATGYSPAWQSAYVPTAVLLNIVATDLVRYRAAMRYDPKEFPKGELMDFVVGVMPAGSLGGGDGVYMNLRRGIVLVDENKPEAVFHELGHAIGLYNLLEQYSWPNYPPNGRPVEGVTLFLNQPTTSNATISGVFVGDPGRVLHTAAPGQWWHDPHLVVVDVMGNTAPFWPHPDTLRSFAEHFYSLAAEPRPSLLSTAADPTLRRIVVNVETERVEVTEMSWSFGERRCAAYRPIIETARLVPRDAFSGIADARVEDPGVTHGALPLCLTADAYTYASGDIQLCVVPIDEDGIMPEYEQCRRVLAPEEVNTARRHDVAVLFYDMPAAAIRYSLVTRRGQVPPLLLTSSAALNVNLLAPQAGQLLTDTVTLRWNSQATLRDPAVPIGQPLMHQVSYSSDGGATWVPVGLPVEGDSMVLGTGFLPPGDQLAFRVTVSDGFRTDEDQVSGLRLPARPPEVTIHSPQDGDRAAPGHAWFLQAWSRDDRGGTPATSMWHSSQDGLLGSDSVLGGVVLSAGTHRLTHTVTDGLGASAQAHVTVTVETMTTVDLAMAPDALAVTMPWRDPVVAQGPRLQTGTSQNTILKLRNTGVAVTATLQLFVQPPGAVERLIAVKTLHLAPFETRWIGGEFTATVAGTHHFRGVVTALSLPDSDAGNDERVWEVMAMAPAKLSVGADTVEFCAPANTPADRSITLRNAGGLGLIIQRVALEQDAALSTGFRLWTDGCSGAALSPSETCTVTVQYTPTEGLEEQVRLEISSTDPDRPAQEILLRGKVGTLLTNHVHVYLPLALR